MTKIKELIRVRWKYYLVGYLIGYAVSIKVSGVPHWVYRIPIKLYALHMALGLGTALYYGDIKVPTYEAPFRMIKYVIFMIVTLLIYKLVHMLLINVGIDITPFL